MRLQYHKDINAVPSHNIGKKRTMYPVFFSFRFQFLFVFSLSLSFFSFCHCWWEGQIALATYKAKDKVLITSLSNSTAFIKKTANPYLMTMEFSYYKFLSFTVTWRICSHSKLQLAFSIGNPTETALLPLRRTRPGTCYWVTAGLLIAAKIVEAHRARSMCLRNSSSWKKILGIWEAPGRAQSPSSHQYSKYAF